MTANAKICKISKNGLQSQQQKKKDISSEKANQSHLPMNITVKGHVRKSGKIFCSLCN